MVSQILTIYIRNRIVGVGALDDPTAKRQFGTSAGKCAAFSGGTASSPSPTGKDFRSSRWAQPV